MFVKRTRDWVSEYPNVIEKLNNRTHSAIGMAPNEVTYDNAGAVFTRLYPDIAENRQPSTGLAPRFSIGQTVRILRPPSVFEKGDVPKTTDEIYKISRILFHPVIRYKLSDIANNNIIAGSYNETELIPVSIPQQL